MPMVVRLNRLAVFVAVLFPCYGATLRGVVNTEDGRLVSGARILVFNDLSIFMIQRGMSDRNGNYQFSVEPGKYRVLVMKKGFLPESATLLVVKETPKASITHALIPESRVDANQHVNNLKRLLRRSNREPFRERAPDLDGLAENRANGRFGGALSSTRRQGGEQGGLETLSLSTKLNEHLQLYSDLTQGSEWGALGNYQRMSAGLEANRADWSWTAQAERIVPSASSLATESLALAANYRDASLAFSGKLARREDKDLEVTESSQVLRHNWFGPSMEQGIGYRDWHGSAVNVRLLELSGRLVLDENGGWEVALAGHELRVDQLQYRNIDAWMLQNGAQDQWRWEAGLGVQGQSKAQLLSKAHLVYDQGAWQAALEWDQTRRFQALDKQAVFGERATPFEPYGLEGVSEQHQQLLRLMLARDQSADWRHEVRAYFEKNSSETIESFGEMGWLLQARLAAQGLEYELTQRQTGLRVEARYLYQQGETGNKRQMRLAVSRSLFASTVTGSAILLQLSVSNGAQVPGWWLLSEPIERAKSEKNWYEGQLVLQF